MQLLNVSADEFIPKQIETNTNRNTTSYKPNQMQFHMNLFNTQDLHGQLGFNKVDPETRNYVLGIMRKQNYIKAPTSHERALAVRCRLGFFKQNLPLWKSFYL